LQCQFFGHSLTTNERKLQPDRLSDGITKGLSQGTACKTDTHQNYTQNFGYSLTEDTAVVNYKHQSVNTV
jgi:hypothetical protein